MQNFYTYSGQVRSLHKVKSARESFLDHLTCYRKWTGILKFLPPKRNYNFRIELEKDENPQKRSLQKIQEKKLWIIVNIYTSIGELIYYTNQKHLRNTDNIF